MSYLKLIEDKIQYLAESLSTVLNVEITVTDKNLLRIAGTGDFYNRINENSPENSLFDKVIKTGKPKYDIFKNDNNTCSNCSNFKNCKEEGNMIYPIIVEDEIVGVVSFATFDKGQTEIMYNKKDEYIDMLKHFSDSIEKEILGIKMINRLNIGNAEINVVINSINRGIIILNSDKKIMHINSKAVKILKINFSLRKIINLKVYDIIKNLKIEDTKNQEVIDNWIIGDETIKVIYKLSYIVLDKENISIFIDFETLDEIINIATKYNGDAEITFKNIVGRSKVLMDVIDKAKVVAKSDSTVLLYGASGTGKELFARSIHNASLRNNGPFIAINCATIPENLIESELFGYEKGAFTGANPNGKIGKFELANNGTLFLDEIADLPLHLQSKLLRVLQEKSIYKLSGIKPIDINVRIISATHKNLEEMVENGQFREDLFYRINVIPLQLPPLKDREEDILMLSEFIINKLCENMNKNNKITISKGVEKLFKAYDWPGNIRELENVLEYAINFVIDDIIRPQNLPEYLLKRISIDSRIVEKDNKDNIINEENKSLDELTKDFEKMVISKYLEVYGDTLSGKKIIANKLNLGLTTLYRKLNDYQ